MPCNCRLDYVLVRSVLRADDVGFHDSTRGGHGVFWHFEVVGTHFRPI